MVRFGAVQRLIGTRTNVERCGAFYKIIAPSRFGKGIATSFISELGTHIEEARKNRYDAFVREQLAANVPPNKSSDKQLKLRCSPSRPKGFFLTGGNELQTQATAAHNAGCGLILIPEIKYGKCQYTCVKNTYVPLLSYFDTPLPARSFRNAEDIPRIPKCRINMYAAGVKEDWKSFVEMSGTMSGS